MINDIYRKYFQKSFTFLYPLLEIKKHKVYKPVKTFVAWKEVHDITDYKLVCLFEKNDDPEWIEFEKTNLISHKMLSYCFPIDDKTIVYVFDFISLKDDFDNFLIGKYSKFSDLAKGRLTNYYGVTTPEWVFMESYLFPENFFETYSKLLNVDVESLKSVGELCSLYDSEKEICDVEFPKIPIINKPQFND